MILEIYGDIGFSEKRSLRLKSVRVSLSHGYSLDIYVNNDNADNVEVCN